MKLFKHSCIFIAILTVASSCMGSMFRPLAKSSDTHVIFTVQNRGVAYFVDEHGTLLFGKQFEDARAFREGYAPVKSGGKWGFINDKGRLVIPCVYDDFCWIGFVEGLCAMKYNGEWGFINTKGELVISGVRRGDWKLYQGGFFFSEGICPSVADNDKIGFIDSKGRVVVPHIYESCIISYEAKAGDVIYTLKGGMPQSGPICVRSNSKWGCINTKGQEVVPCIYDRIDGFDKGYSVVELNGKKGIINTKGQLVVPCVYDHVHNFYNGFAQVKSKGKYGYVDTKGQLAIPCIYDDALEFREGLALVLSDGKWGFINDKGQMVNPCICDFDVVLYEFEGLYIVGMKEKWGCINAKGQLVVPIIYDFIFRDQNERLAEVELNGKYGFINAQGQQIFPCICDYVQSLHGYGLISINGKEGVIDSSGKVVIQPFVEGGIDWSSVLK